MYLKIATSKLEVFRTFDTNCILFHLVKDALGIRTFKFLFKKLLKEKFCTTLRLRVSGQLTVAIDTVYIDESIL